MENTEDKALHVQPLMKALYVLQQSAKKSGEKMNRRRLAFALGVKQTRFTEWLPTKESGIPIRPIALEHAIALEVMTKGEVTAEELCPRLAKEISFLRGTKKKAAK